MEPHKQANGVAPGANGTAPRPLNRRIPSVKEALPYSPLTSIVPFSPEDLPQYKFKIPSRIASRFSTQSDGQATAATPLPKPKLGAFAEMVLNNTDVSYHYPSPVSGTSDSDSPPRTSSSRSAQKPHTPQAAPGAAPQASSSATLVSHGQYAQTLQPSPLDRKIIKTPAVIIPRGLNATERAQYQSYPEVALPYSADAESPSKKRSKDTTTVTEEELRASVDQNQKANAALTKLSTLLADIFEAEDQLQPDTSGLVSQNTATIFVSDDIENPVLRPEIQSQLDTLLKKAAAAQCLGNVEADHLSRIQKLCLNAVAPAATVSLGVGIDWSDSDVEEWCHRLTIAEQGLHACTSLLRVMTAGRQEKELYSEDMLRTLVEMITHVVDTCIVPIIEMRSTSEGFKQASSQSKILSSIFSSMTKVLKLLGGLFASMDVDESAVTSSEFICKTLLFGETPTSEKDSVVAGQKFEPVRRAAMDVMARIFARYTDQRQFIFDEILMSLEKLPVGRQSARLFKLIDSKPIQPASALLMRLVQTSAVYTPAENAAKSYGGARDGEEGSGPDADSDSEDDKRYIPKRKGPSAPNASNEDLGTIAIPLQQAAQKNAQYIVQYLVGRALTSKKSGDEPYRNLLDIFTEDFLTVLGHPDWPAAELLLRALFLKFSDIVDSKQNTVPAKVMALELLGAIASGIMDLQLHAQRLGQAAGKDHSDVTARLVQLHDAILTGDVSETDLLGFEGPYRVVLEYLDRLDTNAADAHLRTARGYHTMRWAVEAVPKRAVSVNSEADKLDKSLESCLSKMIRDPRWLETEYDFAQVSPEDGRLASALITLHPQMSYVLRTVFTRLVQTMTDEQASIRSKSLKSVEHLLEKDPAILDRQASILTAITRSTSDTSPRVRDSAYGLMAKCLSLRPSLDLRVYEALAARADDPNVGIRKRLMKMLKEIYARNSTEQPKFASDIQDALFASFQKLPKSELEEVACCLWTLNGIVGNPERLVRTLASVLANIQAKHGQDLNKDPKVAHQTQRLIPAIVRDAALEALCMICQAWPKEYMRSDVVNAITLGFRDNEPRLDLILLQGLGEFYASNEKPKGAGDEVQVGTGIEAGTERLGKTYEATGRDGALTSIAQRFLQHILRSALSSNDDIALAAARLITSISRQGLIYPNDCGPCLIALITSPNDLVAKTALVELQALNTKYESMFEKEHMRAVKQAYDYQRDAIHDSHGFKGTPPTPKLQPFWEVLKIGSVRARKRFLESIYSRMDFEPGKLDIAGQIPDHVGFTRFCNENIAFFDYPRHDELQNLVNVIERKVTATGSSVAHAIESDILKVRLEPEAYQTGMMQNGMMTDTVPVWCVHTSRNTEPAGTHEKESEYEHKPSAEPSGLQKIYTHLSSLWRAQSTPYSSRGGAIEST
ncbi:Sister chromatid cohesion protein 2 [Zalaria obscura]|uniref:Sister chromatid cohesion protein 2 n=1 Tax=Zalaria obscura TaxID=2024903 RepID=A0ACC3SD37_9PEZI